MRIDFTSFNAEPGGFFELSGRAESRHWAKILRQLREESPWQGCCHSFDDEKFQDWLKETWKIKVITSSGGVLPGFISGIDVDESSYTMLLLRFPK